MSVKKDGLTVKIRGPVWSNALDQAAHDVQLAKVWFYLRHDICRISRAEAHRRSGVSRQFWKAVESGKSLPSGHTEVAMANALRVRPSVIHRLAERWVLRGRE